MGLSDKIKRKRNKNATEKKRQKPVSPPAAQGQENEYVSRYIRFYEENNRTKCALYGLIEFDPDGNAPVYDRPYAETLEYEFSFERWCIWDELEEREREYSLDRLPHGNLIIASEGCGIYWMYIVNGSHAGEVWLYTENGITPVERDLTLERWKNRCLETDNEFWFEAVKYWGDRKYDFFYEHLAPKMFEMGEYDFAVTSPLCRLCISMMQNAAESSGEKIIITDPLTVHVFFPDGHMEQLPRD